MMREKIKVNGRNTCCAFINMHFSPVLMLPCVGLLLFLQVTLVFRLQLVKLI